MSNGMLFHFHQQIRLFGKLISKKGLKGVRISSVDNFQGEESDIVLLSLVRSNSDDSIGFLKFNNRICVALSRAKVSSWFFFKFASQVK